MTERQENTDDWIDNLLDDVSRGPDPDVPDALMHRIMADARDVIASPDTPKPTPWWRDLWAELGGWISVGGLVAATVTGFAIGLGTFGEVGVDSSLTLWGAGLETSDALSANGWDLEES